jgi:hypothetical protein
MLSKFQAFASLYSMPGIRLLLIQLILVQFFHPPSPSQSSANLQLDSITDFEVLCT